MDKWVTWPSGRQWADDEPLFPFPYRMAPQT